MAKKAEELGEIEKRPEGLTEKELVLKITELAGERNRNAADMGKSGEPRGSLEEDVYNSSVSDEDYRITLEMDKYLEEYKKRTGRDFVFSEKNEEK